MQKRVFLMTAAALCLVMGMEQAHAQTLFSIGPYAGYDIEREAAAIGAQARVGIPLTPITIQPGVEFGLGDNSGLVQAEVNALLDIGGPFTIFFTPYVGAGLAGQFDTGDDADSETDFGVNVLGGISLKPPGLPFVPFVQARYTLVSDYNPFAVQGGLLFRFGGPL